MTRPPRREACSRTLRLAELLVLRLGHAEASFGVASPVGDVGAFWRSSRRPRITDLDETAQAMTRTIVVPNDAPSKQDHATTIARAKIIPMMNFGSDMPDGPSTGPSMQKRRLTHPSISPFATRACSGCPLFGRLLPAFPTYPDSNKNTLAHGRKCRQGQPQIILERADGSLWHAAAHHHRMETFDKSYNVN